MEKASEISVDCTKYAGLKRQICEGTSGHSPAERKFFMGIFEGQARATRADTSCAHRGAELEQVVCPQCKTGTRVKVFACGVHGRCIIPAIAGLEEIRACLGCADILHLPTPD